MSRVLLAVALLAALVQPVASQPPAPDAYLIVPGQRIGPVKLMMNITEVTSILGTPKSTQGSPDGSVKYRWYELKGETGGIGLRATKTGDVYKVWVRNDRRYATKEGIALGSTETEIRATLGEPTKVNDEEGNRELSYDTLGIQFVINMDPEYTYYNAVWWIEIYAARPE